LQADVSFARRGPGGVQAKIVVEADNVQISVVKADSGIDPFIPAA